MYVIHLKKKYFAIVAVLVLSTISVFTIAHKKTETLETVALPVNNRVIILDARTWWRRWSEEQAIPVYQKQI